MFNNSNSNRRQRIRTYGRSGFLLIIAGIVIGLACLADRMRPAKQGSAIDFWYYATGINLDGREPMFSSLGTFRFIDERLYYDTTHLHGSNLYVIDADELMSLWPQVHAQFERYANGDIHESPPVSAYQSWRSGSTGSTVQEIIELLNQIQERHVASNEYRFELQALVDYLFDIRVAKANRYVTNFIFEFFWLSFIAWLAFAPLIRDLSKSRTVITWAALPIVLYLPFHPGYGTQSFTSIGPSGGVLYPYIIRVLGSGLLFDFDRAVWSYLPPILAAISQDTTGPQISWSSMGTPWGPVSQLIIGTVTGFAGFRLHCKLNRLDAEVPTYQTES